MQPEGEEEADKALIDKNLNASAHIYNTLNESILKNKEAEVITLPRKEALKLRRAAVICNQSLGGIVKSSRAREDRLIVEQHLMRKTAQRDRIDNMAHRARLLDRMRFQSQSDSGATPVERALRSIANAERALSALSPTASCSAHGAGIIAAQSRLELQPAASVLSCS